MKRLFITAAFIVAAFIGGRSTAIVSPTMPCQYEDEVLVGQGNFTHGQGWDRTVCIPADDLQ